MFSDTNSRNLIFSDLALNRLHGGFTPLWRIETKCYETDTQEYYMTDTQDYCKLTILQHKQVISNLWSFFRLGTQMVGSHTEPCRRAVFGEGGEESGGAAVGSHVTGYLADDTVHIQDAAMILSIIQILKYRRRHVTWIW